MEFTMDMAIAYQVVWGLIVINTVGAFITVFRKPRSIASVLAWMIIGVSAYTF